jgi:hypothetical protein
LFAFLNWTHVLANRTEQATCVAPGIVFVRGVNRFDLIDRLIDYGLRND